MTISRISSQLRIGVPHPTPRTPVGNGQSQRPADTRSRGSIATTIGLSLGRSLQALVVSKPPLEMKGSLTLQKETGPKPNPLL